MTKHLWREAITIVIGAIAPLAIAVAEGASAGKQPFVSPIFGNNMVLQRDKVNTIWGWSEPSDTLTAGIGDKTATGTAHARPTVVREDATSGGWRTLHEEDYGQADVRAEKYIGGRCVVEFRSPNDPSPRGFGWVAVILTAQPVNPT
jgi:hypothetical protein